MEEPDLEAMDEESLALYAQYLETIDALACCPQAHSVWQHDRTFKKKDKIITDLSLHSVAKDRACSRC